MSNPAQVGYAHNAPLEISVGRFKKFNKVRVSLFLLGGVMRSLVTGGTGFVGTALCKQLLEFGYHIVLASRQAPPQFTVGNDCKYAFVNAIDGSTDWSEALAGCDSVVHLAARVHVMHDKTADPLAAFRTVNTSGTLNLARLAANAGVRRFVFLSSVKVNGESGFFSNGDQPLPQDPYAISKWEAEQGLHEIAANTDMEVVILRPPLVYGPGVGANFLQLLRAVDRQIPLPFGLIKNSRSLIYVGNLVDAITTCLIRPGSAGKTYFVSDEYDVSTMELATRLALALGRTPQLLPIPPSLLRLSARMLGKRQVVDRLLDSLTVDSSAIRRDLEWTPPFSMQEGLVATANWYRHQQAC